MFNYLKENTSCKGVFFLQEPQSSSKDEAKWKEE